MASAAAAFQQQLGAEVADLLGRAYKFQKSTLQLRAEVPEARNVVVLSGSNKFSPHIEVSFYFGKNFAAARHVEKLIRHHPFYYHIQQYSLNRRSLATLPYDGPYTWSVNIESPPRSLASEVVQAIHGIAEPFFDRFSTLEAARDAIAANDPWCFGGRPFWSQLLLLDLALGDLAHFEAWAKDLDDFSQSQAQARIAQYKALSDGGA